MDEGEHLGLEIDLACITDASRIEQKKMNKSMSNICARERGELLDAYQADGFKHFIEKANQAKA